MELQDVVDFIECNSDILPFDLAQNTYDDAAQFMIEQAEVAERFGKPDSDWYNVDPEEVQYYVDCQMHAEEPHGED